MHERRFTRPSVCHDVSFLLYAVLYRRLLPLLPLRHLGLWNSKPEGSKQALKSASVAATWCRR